ncbi:terpene synthase family protein [Actinomadura macra]|uniref:terpene synthase family protein n=1 Tax=Actinomadura macra TaxID=46164 RepID=UPI001FDF628F|nr:terpene synthase family protein [Actinomadura macra]
MDCQRDLQEWAAAYPALFPSRPFDARLFSSVALANAFGVPGETSERLRVATRASLWVFAADWVVDYTAKTYDEVEAVVRECMAVVRPRPPGEIADPVQNGTSTVVLELARCLADIQTDLAAVASCDSHWGMWRDQVRRYLAAVAQEWEWKAAHARREQDGVTPELTFERYLANADNFGSSLVNIAHWIFTCEPAALRHLEDLWKVSEQVQRVLRLLNDLASYERDLTWGDLNALMLGVDRAAVTARIAVLVDECHEMLRPLRVTCPAEAVYLERQIGYSTGFYGTTDYWGSL